MAGLGIAESEFRPAEIHTARIVNVNINDWTVDAISDVGDKRFFDMQVMNPYFHYMEGEGIYAMPEVGALCWVCKPSTGLRAAEFILGFQAPFDQYSISYRCGRQSLNPGDIMMRTRDENFIILRRGGVIQIGATPIAQRIYIPIRNFIKDFAENYELHTLGGELTWLTDRDDTTVDGAAPTTFSLLAKEKADDPDHIAKLTIGSHRGDEQTTLHLATFADGLGGPAHKVDIKFTKEGDVTWDVRHNFDLVVAKSFSVTTEEEDVSFDSARDFSAMAAANMNLEAAGNVTQVAGGNSKEDVSGVKTVDAKGGINLGGPAPVNAAVLDTPLENVLTAIVEIIGAAAVGPLAPLAAIKSVKPMIPLIKSTKVKLL